MDASPSFVFFSFFYLFFFLIILSLVTLCVAIVRQARAFARRGPSRLLLTFPRCLTLALRSRTVLSHPRWLNARALSPYGTAAPFFFKS